EVEQPRCRVIAWVHLHHTDKAGSALSPPQAITARDDLCRQQSLPAAPYCTSTEPVGSGRCCAACPMLRASNPPEIAMPCLFQSRGSRCTRDDHGRTASAPGFFVPPCSPC